MGLQSYIRLSTLINEESRKLEIEKFGKDTCPNCNRNRSDWFRNMLGTLECRCGKKFYDEV